MREVCSNVARIISTSLVSTFSRISSSPIRLLVTSMRCTLVSLLRIISCNAFCNSGYPSNPNSVAKRTTVDSLTPTVSPKRDAVIKAALS